MLSRSHGLNLRNLTAIERDGNVLQANLEVGSNTLASATPCLDVKGSSVTYTQYLGGSPATIKLNGGNIIINDNATINVNLPSTPVDGLTYTVWKRTTSNLTIIGNGHNINTTATVLITGGSTTTPLLITITYCVPIGEWLLHF